MQMVLVVGAENNRTSSVSTVQRAAHDDDDDDANDDDDAVDINHDDLNDEGDYAHSECRVPSLIIYLGFLLYPAMACVRGLTAHIYYLMPIPLCLVEDIMNKAKRRRLLIV